MRVKNGNIFFVYILNIPTFSVALELQKLNIDYFIYLNYYFYYTYFFIF